MKRLWAVLVGGILALGLSGCAVATDRLAGSEEFVTEEALPGFSDEMVTSGPAPTPELGSVTLDTERSLIVTGSVYLTVDDPFVAANQIEEIVVSAGGRVDSRSESADINGENPQAYLWVRIPADQLDPTLELIESVGVVESKTLSNQDVTLQRIDLEARVQVLDDAISRLRDLLDTASSTSEIIEIEAALGDRQAELDSLQAQLDYLGDQVAFASIGVDLRGPEAAPDREPDGFIEGIVAGWMGMLAFFTGSIVFAGMLVPWLAGLGIIAVVVWLVVRLRNRRRESVD